MPVDQIVTLLISILVSISTLIIIALGLAVIFGMMRIINWLTASS